MSNWQRDPVFPPWAQSQVTDLEADLSAIRAGASTVQGTFVLSGGAHVFSTGRTWSVGAGVFYLAGVRTTATQQSVTLGAGDATHARVDALVWDASGILSVIAGTPSATPAFPDVDLLQYCPITYINVPANTTSFAITQTEVYRENAEWTTSVSGNIVANSTSNPANGATCIEATAAAANAYVRFTNGAPITLSDRVHVSFSLRNKAAWPSAKSLSVTWYLSGVKVGQSAQVANGLYGFVNASTGVYQQITIPMAAFTLPAGATADRLEIKVTGGGSAIGWYADDVVIQGTATAIIVTQPAQPASATASGTVKTDVTEGDPRVYTKTTMDTLLGAKAPLVSPTFTGTPAAPTPAAGTSTTQLATTAYVQAALGSPGAVVGSVLPVEYTRRAWWHQINAAAGAYESFGVTSALTGSGGNSGSNADSDGYWIGIQTTAVANNVSALTPASFGLGPPRDWKPRWVCRFKSGTDITNVRYWICLSSVAPATAADPAAAHLAGFRYDTGVDGTAFWRACTKDGSTLTATATTVAVVAGTDYTFRVELDAAEVRFYVDDVLVHTATATLPGSSSPMGPNVSGTTLSANIRNWKYSRQYGDYLDHP